MVRVEPGGAAVIAGRARPQSRVTILADGEPIGEAAANAAGEFVVLPHKTLDVGRSELTLRARTPAGDTRRSGDAVVIATPPERDTPDTAARPDGRGTPADTGAPPKPFALKVPRQGSGGAEVLQQPGGDTGDTARADDEPRLAFRVVQYTNTGGLVVSGVAEPDRRVVLRLDARKLGATRADPGGGQWSVIYRRAYTPSKRVRSTAMGG